MRALNFTKADMTVSKNPFLCFLDKIFFYWHSTDFTHQSQPTRHEKCHCCEDNRLMSSSTLDELSLVWKSNPDVIGVISAWGLGLWIFNRTFVLQTGGVAFEWRGCFSGMKGLTKGVSCIMGNVGCSSGVWLILGNKSRLYLDLCCPDLTIFSVCRKTPTLWKSNTNLLENCFKCFLLKLQCQQLTEHLMSLFKGCFTWFL